MNAFKLAKEVKRISDELSQSLIGTTIELEGKKILVNSAFTEIVADKDGKIWIEVKVREKDSAGPEHTIGLLDPNEFSDKDLQSQLTTIESGLSSSIR